MPTLSETSYYSMDDNQENTKGLHLPETPCQTLCTRLILVYSKHPEWGWPVITVDTYCTPPEVMLIAGLGQLINHLAITNPCTNLT